MISRTVWNGLTGPPLCAPRVWHYGLQIFALIKSMYKAALAWLMRVEMCVFCLLPPPPITFDDCLWSLAVMLPHRDATPILIGRWGQMAIVVPVVQIDPDTWTSALGRVRYKAAVRWLLS
jgi:hypothetical protein